MEPQRMRTLFALPLMTVAFAFATVTAVSAMKEFNERVKYGLLLTVNNAVAYFD